jgi:hypothetical protein
MSTEPSRHRALHGREGEVSEMPRAEFEATEANRGERALHIARSR